MPSIIHSQVSEIPHKATTTGFDLPGFQIVECLGVVRGVVVRSRSVVGTLGAGLQTLVGGNLSLFTELTTHMVVATIAGVFFSTLLGCGLFAAAFYSDKSGYDRNVTDATRARKPDEGDEP